MDTQSPSLSKEWNILLTELEPLKQRLRALSSEPLDNANSKKQPRSSSGISLLSRLCQTFNLKTAERDLLLLCVAMEIDPQWPDLCALVLKNPKLAYPSFALAQQLIPDIDISVVGESSPLRYWQLIHFLPGKTISTSVLRISEETTHYLLGNQHIINALIDLFEPVSYSNNTLPASQQNIVNAMTVAWENSVKTFQICGSGQLQKREIAAHFCKEQNLLPYYLRVDTLPAATADFQQICRLWQREAMLYNFALVIDWEKASDDIALQKRLTTLVRTVQCPVIVFSTSRETLPGGSSFTAEVSTPTLTEQSNLWHSALSNHGGLQNGLVQTITRQFSLDAKAISDAAVSVSLAADSKTLEKELWQACRLQARPQLDALCQRIEAKETWEDLILPEKQKQILQMIIAHNRERATVYESWGFSNKSSRGLGTSALFCGQSGTGKTMAANVIAQQLNLDLYKVDLSTVVSKYIGETEKNLKRIFDAAETGGVILLFDEADAIFGKRSEVKDARDRYANMEVSYLLQRMESYSGLAILTTNMKDNIDKAFLRRIRFITTFPFPDYKQRYEIWQKVFPTGVPTQALDYFKLADLDAAGGNIRSIALSAAFLAASERDEEDSAKRGSVTMERILRAARLEFGKMDQPLPLAKPQSWLEED